MNLLVCYKFLIGAFPSFLNLRLILHRIRGHVGLFINYPAGQETRVFVNILRIGEQRGEYEKT
jgi:hypothetical protein